MIASSLQRKMNRLTESMQWRCTNSANSIELNEADYERELYAMHVDKPKRKIQYVHSVLLLRVYFFFWHFFSYSNADGTTLAGSFVLGKSIQAGLIIYHGVNIKFRASARKKLIIWWFWLCYTSQYILAVRNSVTIKEHDVENVSTSKITLSFCRIHDESVTRFTEL